MKHKKSKQALKSIANLMFSIESLLTLTYHGLAFAGLCWILIRWIMFLDLLVQAHRPSRPSSKTPEIQSQLFTLKILKQRCAKATSQTYQWKHFSLLNNADFFSSESIQCHQIFPRDLMIFTRFLISQKAQKYNRFFPCLFVYFFAFSFCRFVSAYLAQLTSVAAPI